MNRREFLKSALTLAALSPLSKLSAKEGPDGDKASDIKKGLQVTRRQYKNTKQTLPLIGYGMMRLPTVDGKIDYALASRLVERAMQAGINYFDTAYMYHGGESQKFVGDYISSKYPRDSFYIANKMPPHKVKTVEDVKRIFNEQLEACKTDYFDFYLMHALDKDVWREDNEAHTYEFLSEMKKQGKIRRLGFSFHDTPDVLQEIVDAHPDGWDFAQIQLNYLDWTLYKSKEQYEILAKAGIPAIIMEPLRGGSLASLNPAATEILKNANPQFSVASWAFRYVASLPNVLCVLSGMTYPEHLEDNINTFSPFTPLNDNEKKTLDTALQAYKKQLAVPCTGCQYCMPCPFGVEIPTIFGNFNQYKITGNKWMFTKTYNGLGKGKISSCVGCGLCKSKCPQKIQIPEKLAEIAKDMGV